MNVSDDSTPTTSRYEKCIYCGLDTDISYYWELHYTGDCTLTTPLEWDHDSEDG